MKKEILLMSLALLLAMSLVATGCPGPEVEEAVVEEAAPPETAESEVTVAPDVPTERQEEPDARVEKAPLETAAGEVTITGELAGVSVGIYPPGSISVAKYYFPAIIADSGYLTLLYSSDHVTRRYYDKGDIIGADTTIAGFTYTHDGVAGGTSSWRISYRLRHTGYGIQITVTGHVAPFDRTPLEMSYWESLEKAGVRDEDGWTYAFVKRAIHVENIEVLTSWDWGELGRQGEAGVEPLIQALKNISDAYIRGKATESLVKIGEPAVEPLIQALKERFRAQVAEVLVKIGDPRAVEPFIQALKDDDKWVQQAAAEALGKIGEAAVEPLIQALKDENAGVRLEAAEALGEIVDARAVEPLIQALKDENAGVRLEAAEALGEIGDARAVEPLLKAHTIAFNAKRRDMMKAIGEALEKIKG